MTKINFKAVIFDFDGTLVDSAESILKTLTVVLKSANIVPLYELNESIIGPPLNNILSNLLNETDSAKVEEVICLFKSKYDSEGCSVTNKYNGIDEMLSGLKSANVDLYIATNKRNLPTVKIVELFNWQNYFSGIYSLDSFSPNLTNKYDMLYLLKNTQFSNFQEAELVYVGDRLEDYQAAAKANIPFLWAQWGYGKKQGLIYKKSALTPKEVQLNLENYFL
jgi:phosphoglycolate phosphatase